MASLRGASELLEMLTERKPPPEGRRHSLMILEGGLKIVVWVSDDRWQSIQLDETDLDRQDQNLIVDDVLTLLTTIDTHMTDTSCGHAECGHQVEHEEGV